MVYGFENRKLIFDFEHLILKLTYPAKTHPGPARDLTETHSGLAQDLTRTCPRLDRDLIKTRPGPTQDLPRT